MISPSLDRSPDITLDDVVAAAYSGITIKELAEERGVSERKLRDFILKTWPQYLKISARIAKAKRLREKWWDKLRKMRNPKHPFIYHESASNRRIIFNTFPVCFWGNASRRTIAVKRKAASVDLALMDLFMRRASTGDYYEGPRGAHLIWKLLGTHDKDILDLLVGIETRYTERAQKKYRRLVERADRAVDAQQDHQRVRVKRVWLDPIWEKNGWPTLSGKRVHSPCD